MYEHRTAPVLPWPAFLRRMLRHGGYVLAVAGLSIAVGMLGFHFIASEAWVDAFLNASMLLGGMGPVGEFPSSIAKVFAGVFALYAGLFFIAAFAVLTAPLLHRLVHKVHADEQRTSKRRPH
jgi:hypothetical protein